MKNGKYKLKTSEVEIEGQLKNEVKDGIFKMKSGKNYNATSYYKDGILVKQITKLGNIKETIELKDGIIYKNQEFSKDGEKFINQIVYDGVYEKHRFGIEGKDIKEFSGNKNDLPYKIDFLELSQDIIEKMRKKDMK